MTNEVARKWVPGDPPVDHDFLNEFLRREMLEIHGAIYRPPCVVVVEEDNLAVAYATTLTTQQLGAGQTPLDEYPEGNLDGAGAWTVPEAGRYRITGNIWWPDPGGVTLNDLYVSLQFFRNAVLLAETTQKTDCQHRGGVGFSWTEDLDAGDAVTVVFENISVAVSGSLDTSYQWSLEQMFPSPISP